MQQIDLPPIQQHLPGSSVVAMTSSSTRGRPHHHQQQQQQQHDRRALYRRSNTLAALPLGSLPTVAQPSSSFADRCRLAPIKDSPIHETSANGEPEKVATSTAIAEFAERRSGPRLSDGSGVTVGSRTSADCGIPNRRSTFIRKASCNDLLLTGRNRTASSGGGGSSGDVTPTASSLLAKVRDRIRETVLTTEWSAAVVLEERRQRAAEQFEAAARSRLYQQPPGGASRRLSPVDVAADSLQQLQVLQQQSQQQQIRHHSPSRACSIAVSASANASGRTTHSAAVAGGRREAARMAFRRRSISCEDAYANNGLTVGCLQPRPVSSAKGSTETIGAGGSSGGGTPLSSRSTSGHVHGDGHPRSLQQQQQQQRGGIVCSNDDFKSLMAEVGRQTKPPATTSPHMSCRQTVSLSGSDAAAANVNARKASPTPSTGARRASRRSVPLMEVAEINHDGHPLFLTVSPDFRSETESDDGSSSVGNWPSSKGISTTEEMARNRREGIPCPARKCADATDSIDRNRKASTAFETNDETGKPEADSASVTKASTCSADRRKSVAPPEVEYDDNGQTWDVYGAELDPEILGSAIQSHLERIMTSSIRSASGVEIDDIADDGNVDITCDTPRDNKSTAGCGGDDDTDSGKYCCDRTRKVNNRKLLLCGRTTESGYEEDDDYGETGNGSSQGFLTRISCLLSKRKQRRFVGYRQTPNYC